MPRPPARNTAPSTTINPQLIPAMPFADLGSGLLILQLVRAISSRITGLHLYRSYLSAGFGGNLIVLAKIHYYLLGIKELHKDGIQALVISKLDGIDVLRWNVGEMCLDIPKKCRFT